MFALGFIFLFSASLARDYGFKFSQEACSRILWYLEYGSALRRSIRITIMRVGSRMTTENGLVRTVNTRKTFYNSLKPAIATCPGLVCALCMSHLTGIRYNLSSNSVRMYHNPGTDASASQKVGVCSGSKSVPAIQKSLVLYCPDFITPFSKAKYLKLLEDAGEARKLSLYNSNKVSILPAFTKAKNGHKRGPSDLINFNDLISPKNLRSAWVQLKSNPGMLTRGANSETII